MWALFTKPSAWLPVAMSFVALMLVFGYVAMYGTTTEPNADEGTAARIFQLLIALQLPIMLVHFFIQFPTVPIRAVEVFAIQISAVLVPVITILMLER